MKKTWTKIDEHIKRMMLNYPGIFPSRVECWKHLFVGNGTGYEWNKKGERVYSSQYDEIKVVPIKLQEIKPNLDDSLFPEYRFGVERENLLRKHTEANIQTVVQEGVSFTTSRITLFDLFGMYWIKDTDSKEQSYLIGPMQEAVINRDKITKEWRHEISYFCEWILSQAHHLRYDPGKEKQISYLQLANTLKKSKIRRFYEAGHAIEVAVKVLKGIFTLEEIKERKKRRKELLDFANKAVGNVKKRLKKESKSE